MKKIKIVLLATVVFIFSMFGVSKADNITVTGNQASDAIITDINGKDVTNNNDLNEWKQYTISYHITLKSNNYSNGNTFKVYMPSNVQVKNSFTLPINSPDGNQIATYSMNKGSSYGTVTITDADWLNKHPLKDFMNITFSVYGTQGNSDTGTWKINKVCWFAQDGGIMWNVAVNNVSGKDNKLIITDQPSSHQTLKGDTVQAQYGYYDNNGNFVVQRQKTLSITKTSEGFSVDLGTYSEKNAQITYETIPDKGYQGYLTNDCQLVENGKVVANNSAEINYNGSANGGGSFEPSGSSSLINNSSSQKSIISSSFNKTSSVNKNYLSSSKLLSSSHSIKRSDSSISLVESSKENSSISFINKPSLNSTKYSSKVALNNSSKMISSSESIKSSKSIKSSSSLSVNKTSKSSINKSSNSSSLKSLSDSYSSKSSSAKSFSNESSSESIRSPYPASIKHKQSSVNSSSLHNLSSSSSNKNECENNLSSSFHSRAINFKEGSSLAKNSSSTSSKLPNTGEYGDYVGMFVVTIILVALIIVGFVIY